MPIPQSFLDDLKQRSDIGTVISGYAALRRQGRTSKCLCPFHSEKTPSMVIYHENQSFYCFGCGAGGDVISFIMRIENLGYIEALRFLAERAGMELPEEEREDPILRIRPVIYEINRLAARFYHDCLKSEAGAPAREYFASRGLSSKTITKYGLGFAPPGWSNLRDHLRKKGFTDEQMLQAAVVVRGKNNSCYDAFRNRVMFPIIDLRKNVIGFGGRVLDDSKPKYLNSSDTPVFKKSQNLFSLNYAKGKTDRRLILAEGYMDVISVNQAGFENVVATLGTSLTAEQSRLMAQYADEVIIAYDSDGAGRAATSRAVGLLEAVGIKTRILNMKGAKDPDEYIKKFGAQRFKLLLEDAGSVTEYQLSVIRAKYDLDTIDQKSAYANEAAKYLATIQNPIERELYAGSVAQDTGVPAGTILTRVADIRKRMSRQAQKKEWSDIQQGKSNLPAGVSGTRSIGAVQAEESIIAGLFRHPDEADKLREQLTAEDFVTEEGKAVFGIIIEKLQQNSSVSLSDLPADLTREQMDYASRCYARQQGMELSLQVMTDCVRALKEYKRKESLKSVTQSDEEAIRMAELIRSRKK
ncbi:MAG: DNA primase [Oscillospiraceae bacterium]|nr:DNA primase [Oscillospiraceae bacterium]